MYRSMKWSVIHKCLIGCLVGLGFLFVIEGILEFAGIRVLSQSEVYVQKVSSWQLQGNLQQKRILKNSPHRRQKKNFNKTTLFAENRSVGVGRREWVVCMLDQNIPGLDLPRTPVPPRYRTISAEEATQTPPQPSAAATQTLPLVVESATALTVTFQGSRLLCTR